MKHKICVVLAKIDNEWRLAFDGENLDHLEMRISYSLKAIADFDNDGKNEYLFVLSSGVNGYGYVLWQDGMAKPLVYKYYSH